MNLHQRLVHECLSVIRSHKLPILPPTIEITDAETFWGQWSSQTSLLKISKKLLDLNRWDWVSGVLRHELAHQYASQILKADDERAHGSAFQLACERVGVPHRFRNSSVDFATLPLDVEIEHPHKAKIEKLLNLAGSNNIFEAQSALKKAQELNAQIYLNEVQSDKIEYGQIVLKNDIKKVTLENKIILDILNKHFFVFSLIGISYDLKKEMDFRTLEIWGRSENLLMAEYVFHFLQEQINFLSKESKNKKSFRRGLLEGFREKLDQQKVELKQETSLSKALILFESDIQLKKYLKQIHPRLTQSTSKSSALDKESYENGKMIGKNLKIAKPLNKSKSQFLGFLISKSSRSI